MSHSESQSWGREDEEIIQKVARDWQGRVAQTRLLDREDFEQELRLAWLSLRREGRATEMALRDRARAIMRGYGFSGRQGSTWSSPPEPVALSELRGGSDPDSWAEDEIIDYLAYKREGSSSIADELFREQFWEWVEGLSEKDQSLLTGLPTKTYRELADELGLSPRGVQERARILLRRFLDQAGYFNNDHADPRLIPI